MRLKTLHNSIWSHGSALLRSGMHSRPQQRQSFAVFPASSGDVDHTAFVAGGGRGLGLEYVRQLLERPQQRYTLATLEQPTTIYPPPLCPPPTPTPDVQ